MEWFKEDNMSDDYSVKDLWEMNRRLEIILEQKGITENDRHYQDFVKHYSEKVKNSFDDETLTC